jgi:hypothetical protein
MRLGTIWSLPYMSMADRIRNSEDRIAQIAASKLPPRIRFWATMVALGDATETGPYANGTTMAKTLDEVVERLSRANR